MKLLSVITTTASNGFIESALKTREFSVPNIFKSTAYTSPVESSCETVLPEVGQETFSWSRKWRSQKLDVIFTPVLILYSLYVYSTFLQWNETRDDIKEFAQLCDPILPHFRGMDFSISLFLLAYGSIILGVLYSFRNPNLLLEFIQTKALVIWIRMMGLYLTPLEAPANTIPLVDPFAPSSESAPLVRDLFFSGHTATTFAVFFICRKDHLLWKITFLFLGLTTATMVILQKTHYVIDVFSAPFFVYACHSAVHQMRLYFGAVYQPLVKFKSK